MSPVSRSRKPKKKPAAKKRRQQDSPLAQVVAQAAGLSSVLTARLWASGLLGTLRWAAWQSDRSEPNDIIRMAVEDLMITAERIGGAVGLAAARALSLVGDSDQRGEFHELAAELAFADAPEPAWFDAYETPELVEAYSITDTTGDFEVLALDYRDHMVGVVIDHVGVLHIGEVKVKEPGGDGAGFATELAEDIWPDPTPDPVLITGVQVLDRLMGPLDQLLLDGPLAHAEVFEDDDARNATMGVALLEALIEDLQDTLPEPSEDDEPDPAERFLAGELPDPELARAWALLVTDNALANGRVAESFSYRFAHHVLLAQVVSAYRIDDADLPRLADVVRAWAGFVGIDWDDQLPGLLDDFAAAYRGHDQPADRVIDFRSYRQALADAFDQ